MTEGYAANDPLFRDNPGSRKCDSSDVLGHFRPPGRRNTSGSCDARFVSVVQASTGYVGTCVGEEVHVLMMEVTPMVVHSRAA